MRQLRMLDHFVDAPNLRRRGADRVEAPLPGLDVFLEQLFLHDLAQGISILAPSIPINKAGIVEHVGAADLGGKCPELALGIHRQQH
jgi:hypothetical protein